MAVLTDYLDVATLRQIQDVFSALARLPVCICDTDGKPVVGGPADGSAAPAAGDGFSVPIQVGDEVVGKIVIVGTDGRSRSRLPSGMAEFIGLVSNVISRLWDREKQLRERIAELGTLFSLTAEFSTQRDLQALLDLVAKTVVEVLGAKACSIRLLSDDRSELVIKAVHNLSKRYLNKGAILVSSSKIDAEVLATGKCVYIADEQTDERVMYPAEARREGIVSALCAALTYKGRAEGVVHVYTSRRHEFDWYEVQLLQSIAAQAAAAIVNARLYREAVESSGMKRQLQLAAEVQRRMLPAKPPKVSGIQIGTIYAPSFELGGDFYDFLDLPPDNMGIAVCDVVGKGVRASLLMASIRASLRAHASNIYDMSQVMARVNRDLCLDAQTSDFATLFYAVLDYRTRRFSYVNAGHMPPLLFRGGQACCFDIGGPVVGINPAFTWRHEAVDLQQGDVLLAYTDGLTEAMNFENEAFGRYRVEQAALTAIAQGASADGVVRHVLWEMRRFAGLQTRLDDLTMVAIKVT